MGIAHGQMDGDKLEKVMVKFIEGEYDVLVSTNIIESGLDIPNANTIIINQAHMFGLSDLHQMRGRVGRSNKKAFCYLLTPPSSLLSSDSRKRLAALEEFSELGDGFKVAMRDLDIRGAGNLLGAEQTGFITDLGFDTYHKILDDAIQELKETDFKELFAEELSAKAKLLVPDCSIETDLEILSLKNGKLRGYFISGKDEYFKSDIFGKILSFVQSHNKRCRMKDSMGKLVLTIETIETVDAAIDILGPLASYESKSISETSSV
jgi:transcription-repair coupling factor (superfamily II helicase)